MASQTVAHATQAPRSAVGGQTADSADPRAVALLLNAAHAFDHMFLLIFATAVGSIAVEFGFRR
jgi:hypothetical protein